jgi:hypothetical protein
MSIILDALKKSESDQQRQTGPALFEVKVAPPKARFPLWAVAIAALLGINLIIVAWLLLRPGHGNTAQQNAAAQQAAASSAMSGITPLPVPGSPLSNSPPNTPDMSQARWPSGGVSRQRSGPGNYQGQGGGNAGNNGGQGGDAGGQGYNNSSGYNSGSGYNNAQGQDNPGNYQGGKRQGQGGGNFAGGNGSQGSAAGGQGYNGVTGYNNTQGPGNSGNNQGGNYQGQAQGGNYSAGDGNQGGAQGNNGGKGFNNSQGSRGDDNSGQGNTMARQGDRNGDTGNGEPTLGKDAANNPDDYAPAQDPDNSKVFKGHIRRGTESGLPLYQDAAVLPGASLPSLRLDLHVYAANPQDRFALINMRKLHEGDSTADGVHVDNITPDGVIMSHNGMKFLLPRD